MPIAGITGQGLSAIGLSVALLWGCLISERLVVSQSLAERTIVMRELRQMQRDRGTQPVSVPSPLSTHRTHVTLG
jgi:hypothetical protein